MEQCLIWFRSYTFDRMSKKSIAIISILKPVDDIRAYEKMAKSIAQNDSYIVHLIGYPSHKLPPNTPNIKLHPLPSFRKLSFERLSARNIVWKKLKDIRPDLIINTTHELLWTCLKSKWLLHSSIIYDIQENYFRNLWYQKNYPSIFSKPIALLTRIKETLFTSFFNHFFLAEKCYEDELSFLLDTKTTVIENKALHALSNASITNERPVFVFTGTLTKTNGILKCLELMDRIQQYDDRFVFKIAGHCPSQEIWDTIHQEQYDFIEKSISQSPINYQIVKLHIQEADYGLVCYELNPSNRGCMPTKVFEYVYAGVTCIYESGGAWSSFLDKERLGISIDYQQADVATLPKLLADLKPNTSFDKSQMTWDSESRKLIKVIDELLR